MIRPPYLVGFDSTTAMLHANARFLRGRGLPMFGMQPEVVARSLRPVARGLEHLPRRLLERVYSVTGALEAIAPDRVGTVDSRKIARWMVSRYPSRSYPALALGSASGALTHLWCALGIPWLPQTFLVGVRRRLHTDEPRLDMLWGRKVARPLLDRNPDLQLHHMHDPSQDRLMSTRMAYFRCKRQTLGDDYERFIQHTLQPGGTLFVADCQRRWPVVTLGERHVFQTGAVGGATAEEFLHGGPRVSDYLRRYRSHRLAWDSPEPDAEAAEAEWGFDERLLGDVRRFARKNGYRVRRLAFADPEAPSPWVADLYRWWYRRRNRPARRLLVSSFAMLDPYWTLRTGSVPFWMTFNKEPSADALERYMRSSDTFDEVYLSLFSHGVDSIGLVPIARWIGMLGGARKSALLGVDPTAYPRHLTAIVEHDFAIRESIAARYPLPATLSLGELEAYVRSRPTRPPVTLVDELDPVTAPASAA